MFRFRPILPKPTPTEGAVSVGSQNVAVSKRRPKRKYVRVRRKNGYDERIGGERETPPTLVTLPLMPERDSPEVTFLAGADGVSRCKNAGLEELDLTVVESQKPPYAATEAAGECLDLVTPATAISVETWVTVESVSGTCMGEGEGIGGGLLGCTDLEKVKNILETDTCPGFVSDGYYCHVRWVNDAYKRMVLNSEDEEEQRGKREVVVRLKLKESVAWCYSYPAFTCGVRWQYTWRNEKCTKMVPCDVWRLDCGGFAWRLDVKAALSLGL